MSLHARIKQKLEEKNLRAADLARATKKSPVSAKKWLDGVSVPTAENLKVIARFLGVTDDWLLFGGKNEKKFDNNVMPITSKLIPVLSWVQAGSMTSVESIDPLEIAEWLPPLSVDDPDGCFYLKVVGISNYPTYMEGDCILVNPKFQVCDLLSGDLIVVRNNTDATFKKFVIESDERRYLQALNPNFHPNIIEFEEGMELVGLVIDAFRPLGGSRPKRMRKS
ncbi:LexA family transcriptional regulator [Acinetobacter sp. WCHAc060025]|uniref:LexA family transcriptional regulator n=1 Tax=Acinetobacter sp. WCHAc060025 TaxID=2518625 RepID=UPI001022C6FA|nr:LexA family transcriptional regulator [Acinetobacter sp. WCHAc060025]RZG71834.1 helix-turn-helix domain-containing protein [Acinetobacter sp. WCHAc060025]